MGNKIPLIRVILFLVTIGFMIAAAFFWWKTNSPLGAIISTTLAAITGIIQVVPPFQEILVAGLIWLEHAIKSAMQGLYKSWRKHSSWKNILIVVLVILLLVSVGFNIRPRPLPSPPKTLNCSTPICVMPETFDDTAMYLGINDGSKRPFFNQFDPTPDSHSTDGTEAQLTEAQLERDIYKANHEIVGPYITLLLATTLSRSVKDPISSLTGGINDLRGAYIAQKYYNITHPTFQLRLLIANLGTREAAVTTVPHLVKQIEQLPAYDKTFVGVVGFPFSKSAKAALNSFKDHTIPIVSPSATSDELANYPNFYRIVSPDQEQSAVIVKFMSTRLQTILKASPCLAVFVDNSKPPDPFSQTLGNGVLNSNIPKKKTELYREGDPTSIISATNDAVNKGCGVIFFAGFPDDLNVLRATLKESKLKREILLMGGSALYNLGGYTGDNYHNLIFAANATYAYPNSTAEDPNFVREYSDSFDPKNQYKGIYGPSLPEVQAILSFDAIHTYLNALASIIENNTSNILTQPTLKGMSGALPSVNFDGVSGHISLFHGNASLPISNPVSKYIYIACTDNAGLTHIISTYQAGNGSPTEVSSAFHPNALDECLHWALKSSS